MLGIVRGSRVKFDSALGLVLSVFFGFGLMVLTYIQRQPDASQAGLDKFLFGQAATLIQDEVQKMAIVGAIALGILLLFWKSFKLLSFDSDFAATIGYPVRLLDVVLTTLIVVAIVIGLQAVGVVLMSAMIVAPGGRGPAMDQSAGGDGDPGGPFRGAGRSDRRDVEQHANASADRSDDRRLRQRDRALFAPLRAEPGTGLGLVRAAAQAG